VPERVLDKVPEKALKKALKTVPLPRNYPENPECNKRKSIHHKTRISKNNRTY